MTIEKKGKEFLYRKGGFCYAGYRPWRAKDSSRSGVAGPRNRSRSPLSFRFPSDHTFGVDPDRSTEPAEPASASDGGRLAGHRHRYLGRLGHTRHLATSRWHLAILVPGAECQASPVQVGAFSGTYPVGCLCHAATCKQARLCSWLPRHRSRGVGHAELSTKGCV